MSLASALDAALRGVPELRPGEVWLAGAGPGDPALLTLHALAGLDQAEIVLHDSLVDPRVLALARPDARRIFAGKRGGQPSTHQGDITAQLVGLAREGARVLRLKGGDPYVFGRGAEEALALAEEGIPFRVIPGITSGLASLTMGLMPATVRGINRAILLATGHGITDGNNDHDLDWAQIARLGQPIVLYMAIARLPAITEALLAGGLPPDTAAAVIGSATMLEERVVVSTLARLPDDIARCGISAPAIVAIGEIVRMRAKLLALLPQLGKEAPPWPPG
ncbi:MAG TPA: uroporphyrinogen-III C-methyltransferase [Acetobacteraceae bacterium]|nr:uroporphyrinogen-III C-methyltransferase [Acetobacteraceae bacterium]